MAKEVRSGGEEAGPPETFADSIGLVIVNPHIARIDLHVRRYAEAANGKTVASRAKAVRLVMPTDALFELRERINQACQGLIEQEGHAYPLPTRTQ